jgi:predicted MPP superfamily phosphohydrolase
MRVLNHFLAFYPQWISVNYARTKLIVLGISAGTVLVLIIAGYINARMLRIRTLDITIPKQAGQAEPVNLVLATDLHAGIMLGRAGFKRIVDKINSLDPDAVLLAGDILDADLKPVLKEDFGKGLESLKSRLGVFACTGNHEYYGGIQQSTKYLSEHNIILLRDSSMLVDDRFYLVGREDKQREAFSGNKRTPLKELMSAVDTSYPVIVLDHQPYRLEEAAESGADLQVSGHTHNGQLWPFGFITNRLFEIAYGYGKKGNTHFYVSSGAGSWGPPVRIGSSPEIVNIRVRFK